MSEQSKPTLDVETVGHYYVSNLAAAQTEPLDIPPGCSIPMRSMIVVAGAAAAVPVMSPPSAVFSGGGGRPVLPPPEDVMGGHPSD